MIRIAAVQMHPAFGDPQGNRARARALIESCEADLYVLPELYATGYLFLDRQETASYAEPFPDGETIRSLCELSAATGSVVVAGYPERSAEGRVYNSAAVVDAGDPLFSYRKIHLFDHERSWFDPGDRPPQVIETSVGRIGPMICFDWIFPETARCLALAGAQILVHCANLVLPYCQDAMITRCIENRVFAVTANRIGTDERGDASLTFTGRSQLTGHHGERLVQASLDREEVIVSEITPEEADDKQVTPRNHIVSDRRPGLYGQLTRQRI